mgnify:CR=1 FL=1
MYDPNFGFNLDTIELDLMATEMLAFLSKSSRNKNDSDIHAL